MLIDWGKCNGLIPVIVQDEATHCVVMQAYANKEALDMTFKTGFAHYFSRSRNSLWKKGETSGNTQKIVKIKLDCDGDSILYIVNQKGPACHTGEVSCFYRELKGSDVL